MRKRQRIYGGRGGLCGGLKLRGVIRMSVSGGGARDCPTHGALMCSFLEGRWPGRICSE